MNTADMLVHVHPELGTQARIGLERSLMGHIGIDCAEFEHRPHPHSLLVKDDPETIKGIEILQMVRKLDPAASLVGL